METNLCPKTPACPIFNGILKGTEFTEVTESYIARPVKPAETLQAFQIATLTGKCPPNVLPNATKTAEQIIAEMKHQHDPAKSDRTDI